MSKMACTKCSHIHMHSEEEEEEHSYFEENFWYFIGASGILILLSISLEFFFDYVLVSQIFALSSIILSGYDVFRETIENLRDRRITANLLMVIAAIASFIIMHGQEGAVAILLYAIAEHLEEITTERSHNAINELLELAPDEALVKQGDKYNIVPSEKVQVGEIIGIKPGMKVPLDGEIIEGTSYIDESAITGESLPAHKTEGDEVFAGSLNSDSFLEVRVTKPASETVIAQIAETIVSAQENKSQKERFIEKFARYYTPSILIVALLIIIIPSLLFGQNFINWFYRGLILLVISCPCALTLSTPLANVIALTKLAREGILVKGNKFVEQINDIEVIALDKTGTLTEGNLKVYNVYAYNTSKDYLLQIAGSLEILSEHPIGKAIVDYAQERTSSFFDVNDFQIEKGKGIEGIINGEKYYIGNKRYLSEKNIEKPTVDLPEIEEKGVIPVLIASEDIFLGILTIRDAIRLTSPILIDGLKKRGYKTVMISGDTQMTCDTVGGCLNLDSMEGELLPDQKLDKIRNLKKQTDGVLMIGDGINDAPALSLTDVSIAIGASATDITLETADVVIMNDDLTKILTFIDVAKKTNKIIKQNIWISIIVKLSFAVLTVLGLMTLWLAVGTGDLGVSLFVLLNGMLIYRYKSQFQEINSEFLEREASFLVCENCQEKNVIPQHHGRDMIKRDDKLICWKKLVVSDKIESCDKQVPLYCPNCESKLALQ